MIHDAAKVAVQRMAEMVREAQAIITESGQAHSETRIDTICLHGDTPTAVSIAGEVRRALTESGVRLKRFEGVPV